MMRACRSAGSKRPSHKAVIRNVISGLGRTHSNPPICKDHT